MRQRAFLGALTILSGLMLSALSTGVASGRPDVGATQRHVQGIITDVEAASVTITPVLGKTTVTGRVDDRKTKIVLDGRAAKVSDLKVTFTAKGDLGLDDVWTTLSVQSAK